MKHAHSGDFSPHDAFPFGERIRRAASESDAELALAKARGKARAEGFEEGVRQTEARIDRETQDAFAAIAAAVELARVDREAAERDMAAISRRIVIAFLTRIAPSFAETSLIDEVADVVQGAFSEGSGGELRVRVAPHQRDEIEAALIARDLPLMVEGDPAIGPARAEAFWAGGFEDIDIGALADRAIAILDAALSASETTKHTSETTESL